MLHSLTPGNLRLRREKKFGDELRAPVPPGQILPPQGGIDSVVDLVTDTIGRQPFIPKASWIPDAVGDIASRWAVPLYRTLRRHCFESPECFPSQRRLAHLAGCSVGTVNRLTNEFHRLGIIEKLHRGRHCLYRIAAGFWRRRRSAKSSKSAHCSTSRTEDRITYSDPVTQETDSTKTRVSQRFALAVEQANKRRNLIKGLHRWVQLSPHLADEERPHRLTMLDRTELAITDWRSRTIEDKRCFEWLVSRARASPLDAATVQACRQQRRLPSDGSLGAVLARQGWFRGGERAQAS